MKKKKKILFAIIPIIIIVIIVSLYFIYPVIKNNNYQENIEESIYKNTDITKITYLNKDNNYYIVKTSNEVIVLDLNYEEVYRITLSELKDSDMDLTYRRGSLYYKDKVREKNKLTYHFYDVKTLELIYESNIGG